MNKKPNIVFFFTDDQRFDTINALGNTEISTPNIDKLVRAGTSFTQAHIPCGTTGAVCMPSRAMLHTGRTLFHIEKEGQRIPKEHATIGETLKKVGYRTFGTGKWHNGRESFARSFTDGGEIFFGGMWDHWNVPAYNYDLTGKYEKVRKVVMNPSLSNKVETNYTDHITMGKHSTDLFGDISVEFIEKYNDENPFFMYISFMAPHDPRTMPEEFLNMYNSDDIKLPENYREEHLFDFGIKNCRDEKLAAYPRTEEKVKRHISEYYGMISHLDNQIGRVLDSIEKKGELENTIFIFAGDNGLALGQHGLFGKQNHYEHSIRVPLIFSGPGIPKDEKRDTYVYLLDIFPTICEILDVDKPETVEGRSLLPAIKNSEIKVRENLYFAYTDMLRSVKNHRYKLIEYRTANTNRTQLFDIVNDPTEVENLFGKQEFEEIINILTTELLNYKESWNDEKHPLGKKYWQRYNNNSI